LYGAAQPVSIDALLNIGALVHILQC
jgi:hypothetical protein